MYRPIHLIPAKINLDYMRLHRPLFLLSLIMVVGSILLIAIKGLNFGIDFQGGILMELRSEQAPDLAQLRGRLSGLGIGEVALQEFGSPNDILVRIQRQAGEQEAQLTAVNKVKQELGDAFEYRRTEFVGPKVGAELIHGAVWAVAIALLGIMAYIWFRYEWQFAINAIVALFHDCITTVGLFSLLGLQFDLASVAAVLTIAGYSVNDTVVIYDRIRDELRRYKKMPLPQLLNQSINKTLSRTTVTSGLTLLSVLAIVLFGGEVLRGFAIALIWGIVVGTYSTIFVASPMLIYLNLRGIRESRIKRAGTEASEKP
jgi:preprotein translocase subunit SecF